MEMFLLFTFGLLHPIHAAPVNSPLSPVSVDQVIDVPPGTAKALLWSSIGLAVLTALIQGLVTALAFMTESSNHWTFRFRLAKIEHWWWTVISAMLTTSLVLIILSFLAGRNGEAVSILALSTATFLAIVRYALPSWRSRKFIRNRWLAWTGDSRTTISFAKAGFCGDRSQWRALIKQVDLADVTPTPSDWYGWHIWPVPGLPHDPTDVLRNVSSHLSLILPVGNEDRRRFIYDDGSPMPRDVSLLWGSGQGFRKRVSRATASMPSGLLRSQPFTTDGYAGEGLCLAMGILGRTKGLQPRQLVFKMTRAISNFMENNSTWTPRPAKVLRSYYKETMEKQYSYLGNDFIDAAVELALLLVDVRDEAIGMWLQEQMEHQSLRDNRDIAELSTNREAELKAHYESSYVSMIISLNNMDKRMKYHTASRKFLERPDIICTGLLLKARGQPEPKWWNGTHLADVRKNQIEALSSEANWKPATAQLLGLSEWPRGFEDSPSVWDENARPKDSFAEEKSIMPKQEVLSRPPVQVVPRATASSDLTGSTLTQSSTVVESSA
ncbi:MAG: hypothetical protein M1823_005167 [Watsoniomyces obsoletus]|nr:MAG: hypothetical protein M1823_005167 [Watsoniomyces obsoletus]